MKEKATGKIRFFRDYRGIKKEKRLVPYTLTDVSFFDFLHVQSSILLDNRSVSTLIIV